MSVTVRTRRTIVSTRREFLVQTAVAGVLAATGSTISCASASRELAGGCQVASPGWVQTVRGAIDASRLGFTLTHEHICRAPSGRFGGRLNAVAKAVDKLKAARDEGIDTIVDVTPFDAGRDVRFGEEVSRKSGMQIVACTGQHFFAPESLNQRDLDEITGLFIKEIEHGIEDTDIRAGVIKVAARSGVVTPAEEKVFRAAARASRATGVAVETHTNSPERGGEKQAEIFEAEGLSPARVSLGHSNDTDDIDYLTGLAKRGYTLGMDHAFWGLAPGARLPWEKRVECVRKLIGAGFVNQLLLSNDWVFGDFEREEVNPDGLLYTTRKTIPCLRQLGVSQQDIETMTVRNPARFFAANLSL